MEFDVKMTAGILYNYLIRQNYTSINGWVGIGLGLMMIALYIYNGNFWALIAGFVVILYPFLSFYTKSKKQMLLNPAFKTPIHYKIDDDGIRVSQNANEVLVTWEQLFKVVSTKKIIIIYTSPVNAWLIPHDIIADKADWLKEMIITKVPAAKIKNMK